VASTIQINDLVAIFQKLGARAFLTLGTPSGTRTLSTPRAG
jgi:hypothetical protein